jgi:hypothetical protein
MNLFNIDPDIDKCAEYHIDKHVGKMQLETAQMMCTNHWIDHLFGYVPRKITSEEHKELKEFMKTQRPLPMENRLFPYLACHHNHPSTVWMRESLSNYEWSFCYAHALSEEQRYRTGGSHKSFEVIKNLPELKNMKDVGPTLFKLAMTDNMPKELVDPQRPIWSYRNFYMLDKAAMSSWKNRSKPWWWDEDFADYEKRISGQ